ncbi:hypothetical protein [Fodinibius salsisoli]|uniref:Uncharacterized protein n=1 Tax=Fodinibius salsisoli TaxID=2820877 RepID=A0ABT3PI96_9BACT|nr:hypothetical protein [Fodinibius salsisoli]MCW9705629.1 hypothetical protein [Fodinibius salsisoli]
MTPRGHLWKLFFSLMGYRLVKDIKHMYHSACKGNYFQPIFERKLAQYIQRRAPKNSIHWQKLKYEFHNIYRKCRDGNKSAAAYLEVIAELTEAALDGAHKQVELDVSTLKVVSAHKEREL